MISVCASILCSSLPDFLSQIFIVLSEEQDTIWILSDEKLTSVTPSECPYNFYISKNVFISQILIVLSYELVANYQLFPSDEKQTPVTIES